MSEDTVPRFGVVPASTRVSAADRETILRNPGFGRYFTDHMARAVWTRDAGWHDADVRAVEPLVLHPSAAVLHYAQEIFEGLKAYRQPDGSVALFRPDMNAARFRRSAARLALPELPVEMFLDSVEQLVRTDVDWVPDGSHEASLYLRPYAVATEAYLGVRPADEVFYGVIASPAGAYFAAGSTGITLWVSTEFVRAAPGGTGAAKCGGNYAASLLPQVQAQEQGCDQVLYTVEVDGQTCIDESGTMNVFLVTKDGELVTPSLAGGTILSGVTRDSVLTLAKSFDLNPVERQVSLAEVLDGVADGTILEVFAAGTAAVITPITGLKTADRACTVADGSPGRLSEQLRQHIVDIQFGRRDDEHGWLHRVT
ncbi:branched-chain amino acid aminotransferase [uncultured Jatrophihabitans sp.]|uniref:branched-chain amino acid aminotransferase n=1 Tax=uncultured Jatrophihabitans sp. TaxID=1610747 RepID=UPI0035C9F730